MESMIQIYVKESGKALEFYKKAFDAKVKGEIDWDSEEEGIIIHAELQVFGQTLAISDVTYGIGETTVFGNNIQICFRGGTRERINKIYEALKEGAVSHSPPGNSGYSEYCFGLTDKYGIHWCIFE